MNKRWFLVCIACVAIDTVTPRDLLDATAIKAENTALRKCNPGSNCPVFYTSALGGFFPVPTRYFLVTRATGSRDVLMFKSPVRPFVVSNMSPREGLSLPSGSIDIEPKAHFDEALATGLLQFKVIEKHGSVEFGRVRWLGPDGKTRVTSKPFFAIVGNEEWISVSDDNDELASNLFRIYKQVNPSKR